MSLARSSSGIVARHDSLRPGIAANPNTPAPNESRSDDPRYLALVFSMVDDAAVVTDIHGRVVDFNPAARRLLACVRGEPLACPNRAGAGEKLTSSSHRHWNANLPSALHSWTRYVAATVNCGVKSRRCSTSTARRLSLSTQTSSKSLHD